VKFSTSLVKFGSVGDLAIELKKALTAIAAGWNVEHNPDGTHKFPSGRWTPVLGGVGGTSGQAYSLQAGQYARLGGLVIAWYRLRLTAKGGITGNVQIQGLPFRCTSALGPLFGGTGQVVYWTGLATAVVALTHYTLPGTNTAQIVGITAATTTTLTHELLTGDLTDTTDLLGSVTYWTED
jgi:hypothetical protein